MNTASQQKPRYEYTKPQKNHHMAHGHLYIMQSTLPSMYSNQPHPQIIHQHQLGSTSTAEEKKIKNKIE